MSVLKYLPNIPYGLDIGILHMHTMFILQLYTRWVYSYSPAMLCIHLVYVVIHYNVLVYVYDLCVQSIVGLNSA